MTTIIPNLKYLSKEVLLELKSAIVDQIESNKKSSISTTIIKSVAGHDPVLCRYIFYVTKLLKNYTKDITVKRQTLYTNKSYDQLYQSHIEAREKEDERNVIKVECIKTKLYWYYEFANGPMGFSFLQNPNPKHMRQYLTDGNSDHILYDGKTMKEIGDLRAVLKEVFKKYYDWDSYMNDRDDPEYKYFIMVDSYIKGDYKGVEEDIFESIYRSDGDVIIWIYLCAEVLYGYVHNLKKSSGK